MEVIVEEILRELGYKILEKKITTTDNAALRFDQLYTDGEKVYFVEQKVRDDHDSTKKRGQIQNFKDKLDHLYKIYGDHITGSMYFLDAGLTKNKNYYLRELEKLSDIYRVEINLFYGNEFFESLGEQKIWDELLLWLRKWKQSLPDFPEVNLDANPNDSFNEIKDMDLRVWRKLLTKHKIWDEGVMRVLFGNGATLRLISEYFLLSNEEAYHKTAQILEGIIEKSYV